MSVFVSETKGPVSRLPYQAPSLTQYGSVIELTASGTNGLLENNGTQTSKLKP